MGEGKCTAYEIKSAVRSNIRAGKGLPVNADREWQRNAGGAIIAMVACVIRPSHDRIGARARYVVTARNGRPCRRRRGRSSCYRAVESVYLVGSACGGNANGLHSPSGAHPKPAAGV